MDLAANLYSDPEAAEQAVDAMFSEIPADLRHHAQRATLEAWLLAEVVDRARRHEREAAAREQRRREREATARDQLWRRLHQRGELLPLLDQLPAIYAYAFRLHCIERAPLREVMRLTGASAGVITHRIGEAIARLDALTACMIGASRAASSSDRLE